MRTKTPTPSAPARRPPRCQPPPRTRRRPPRRAAAAVHHLLLLTLDSQSGVGEGIGDRLIPSTAATAAARTWQSLGDEEAGTAYRAIRQLLDDAPDLSRWAVDMAAEHLVPEAEALTRWQDDTATVRLHLAFADHVTTEQRTATRAALRLVLRTDF